MTLREAILDAHKRGDVRERNALVTYARERGATMRALSLALGVGTETVWRWSGGKHDRTSAVLTSTYDPNTRSITDRIGRVEKLNSDPAPLATAGVMARKG